MAVKAPRHAERLFLFHHFHLPDVPVTADATDPGVQMGGMAEIDVVGEIMHPDPFDRGAGRETLLHDLELVTRPLHDLVAVDAGLRGGDVGHRRLFDPGMAVAAVHSEITGVHLVAEGNRLDRTIADIGVFWGKVVPNTKNDGDGHDSAADQQVKGDPVDPFWKNLRQRVSFLRAKNPKC